MKTIQEPIRIFHKMEKSIGSVVNEILIYRQKNLTTFLIVYEENCPFFMKHF